MTTPMVHAPATVEPARSPSPTEPIVAASAELGAAGGDASVRDAHARSDGQSIAGTSDGILMFYAEGLDDLEGARIAFENRARSVEQAVGPALAERQAAMAAQLKALEHQATLELKRALRKHPLGPWVKDTIGVGEKQAARLLAAIGDPAWNTLYDRPRKLRELYAFCGLHVLDRPIGAPTAKDDSSGQGSAASQVVGASHKLSGTASHPDQVVTDSHLSRVGVAPSRTKGQRANWSNTAKMRVYVIAESCLKAKARSPYGPVYDNGRAKYADAVHRVECRRCGPKGKPALVGSPLNPGHQHARAMRLVMKAVLRDMWVAAQPTR